MQQSVTRGAVVQAARRSSRTSSIQCSARCLSLQASSSKDPSQRRSSRSPAPSSHSFTAMPIRSLLRAERATLHTSASSRSDSPSSPSPSLSCPACFQQLPSDTSLLAQCPSCSAFLPPPPSLSDEPDYFALFSLSPTFDIPKADLRRSFLQWQGRVHPDRLSQIAAGQEREGAGSRKKQEMYAAAWSSLVNEGYKMLLSDSARGEYMLRRRGVAIEEQDKMEDPELLMEILEIREALEEASTEEQVAEIRDTNRENTKDTLASMKSLLEAPAQQIDVAEAKNLLIRLRYQDNVEGVCKEWQPGKQIVLQH